MISRNKHSAKGFPHFRFGLSQITDGVIRILSFGYLTSSFTLECARTAAMKQLEIRKQRNTNDNSSSND